MDLLLPSVLGWGSEGLVEKGEPRDEEYHPLVKKDNGGGQQSSSSGEVWMPAQISGTHALCVCVRVCTHVCRESLGTSGGSHI